MLKQITVAWFSAGVSSAVATKLMIEQVDKVIYQHIDDQDQDTLRFVSDCETWFGKPIEIRQSPYRCVNNACRGMGFVNGPYGATCSRLLKRRDRQEWEAEHRFFCTFRYVWGMDVDETRRAERLREDMREDEHAFPLIERGLTKQDAHGILREARIARPRMYDMGYPNNNCRGCVKGARGYWNKVRVDMPDVFRDRAAMERAIGGTCINGVYLDELDQSEGRDCKIVLPECGAMCEAAFLSIANRLVNAPTHPKPDAMTACEECGEEWPAGDHERWRLVNGQRVCAKCAKEAEPKREADVPTVPPGFPGNLLREADAPKEQK